MLERRRSNHVIDETPPLPHEVKRKRDQLLSAAEISSLLNRRYQFTHMVRSKAKIELQRVEAHTRLLTKIVDICGQYHNIATGFVHSFESDENKFVIHFIDNGVHSLDFYSTMRHNLEKICEVRLNNKKSYHSIEVVYR